MIKRKLGNRLHGGKRIAVFRIVEADVFQTGQRIFDGFERIENGKLLLDVVAIIVIHKIAELGIVKEPREGMDDLIEGDVLRVLEQRKGVAAADLILLTNQIAGIEVLQAAEKQRDDQKQYEKGAEIPEQSFAVGINTIHEFHRIGPHFISVA